MRTVVEHSSLTTSTEIGSSSGSPGVCRGGRDSLLAAGAFPTASPSHPPFKVLEASSAVSSRQSEVSDAGIDVSHGWTPWFRWESQIDHYISLEGRTEPTAPRRIRRASARLRRDGNDTSHQNRFGRSRTDTRAKTVSPKPFNNDFDIRSGSRHCLSVTRPGAVRFSKRKETS